MTTRHEGMTWLKSLKGERATRYDVREIGIFGSGARGEDDNQSDSNLLAESGSRADLITDIGLGQYLYDTFGTEIDLVAKGGLRSDVRDKVMQDLVLAGERSRLVEHSSEDLKERAQKGRFDSFFCILGISCVSPCGLAAYQVPENFRSIRALFSFMK